MTTVHLLTDDCSPNPGGLQASVIRIARMLAGEPETAVVIYALMPQAPLPDRDPVDAAIRIHSLNELRDGIGATIAYPEGALSEQEEWSREEWYRTTFLLLRNRIGGAMRESPRAAHVALSFYLPTAGFFGQQVSGALGIPHVACIRGSDFSLSFFSPDSIGLIESILRRAAHIVTTNHEQRRIVQEMLGLGHKTTTIYNSVAAPGGKWIAARQGAGLRRAPGMEEAGEVAALRAETDQGSKRAPALDEGGVRRSEAAGGLGRARTEPDSGSATEDGGSELSRTMADGSLEPGRTEADAGGAREQAGGDGLEPVRLVADCGYAFKKGTHILISAFEALAGEGLPLRLSIIGATEPRERDYWDAVKAEVRARQGERVSLGDYRPPEGIEAFLAAGELYCSATLGEGCSQARVRAMLLGMPMVTTLCGEAGDLGARCRHWFLAQPGDQEDFQAALRRACLATLRGEMVIDSGEVERLGEAFSAAREREAWAQVLSRVRNGHRRAERRRIH